MKTLEDKDFVESILKTKVISYEVTSGCKIGDNVAGSLKAITAIDDNGTKFHVVYKFIPENPSNFIINEKIFRTEHAIYKTVAPMMENFARSKGLTYSPAIPKYFSGFNNDCNDYIVLEDVRPSGYVMPDKNISRTYPEMSIILKELAKFHAVAYGMIQYEGESIFDTQELSSIYHERHTELTEPTEFDKMIHHNYEVTVDLMQDRLPELAKRMAPLIPRAGDIRRSTDFNPNYFATLIHCDLWTNNLMIKHDDKSGEPIDVKFLDFQFARRGNVFSELQYLIFTSTNSEFRKQHLIPSLSLYYDTFSATLKAMKIPCPVGFTQGFLIDEFKKCYLPGYVHMTFAIPLQIGVFVPPTKTDEDELFEAPVLVKHYYFSNDLTFQKLVELTEEFIDLELI